MPDPTGRVSHLPDMHRGVAWKEPVRVATSSNIAITGQGAGAAIDGVTLVANDRILLKDQTAASSNGIYIVRTAGQPAARSFDMDQDASSSVPASEVVGAVVQVVAGGSNGGTFWRTTNTTAPIIGTDAINWLHMPMSGGGGGGVISAGSNSKDVSGRSFAGASSTLWSPYDHEHLGVVAITSSSSNTLQRPTVNIRAGTNVGVTATDSDGDGNLDTLTIHATATSTGGGSGSLTQAYVGYNTVGGSWETMTNWRVFAKKVTLANDCLLTNIEAYLRDRNGVTETVSGAGFGLYTDNSGTPGVLISQGSPGAGVQANLLDSVANTATGAEVGRWYGQAFGMWLTAGDYWIAYQNMNSAATIRQIAYDGSGSDRYYTSGGQWMVDWGWYTPTTSSNKYSIRANTVR